MIYAEVGGNIAAKGLVQGMEGLTNAIVGDERVFHITDTSFFRRAKHQITLESVERKGWYDVAHNETVKEEILKRLDKEGWDTVRPAIAATVRAWIFTAYIRSDPATNQRLLADDFYGRALDLCDWGRQQWPDVPRGDRGAIFELSFIRGIKRLKLENMFTEFSANWGKRSSFSQQNVTRCAESLIEDVVKDPASQEIITDISGHYELHWLRPKGSALSILGWINAEFGRAMGPAQRDRRIRTLRRAGQYYLETAEIHPVDDEQYLYCLRVALECLPEAGAPLKEILPLCKRFREVVPGVLQIWEMGSFGFRIKIWDREMEGFIEAREKAIKAGEETLESVVALPPAFP
ncbi:hypothetical protein CC2G_000419 [Coprinopsis cinerea AmutBmut pab1-1]|nr:hypothetical protein CC2G_000419 [Coprinopsis cinerea AmutBmut pab1-1]